MRGQRNIKVSLQKKYCGCQGLITHKPHSIITIHHCRALMTKLKGDIKVGGGAAVVFQE